MASEQVGSIHYDLILKTNDFDQGVKKANSRLDRLRGYFDSATRSSKMLAGALGGVALAGAGLAFQGVKIAAELETIEAGLSGVLKNADEAAKVMDRVKQEAARTPFEIAGLSNATRLMATVTKDGDKAIDIVLDIGEALTAMGKGQADLDGVIVNMQQISTQGRANLQDVRQFATRGIPIWDMLRKETGKSGKSLQDFVSKGGVTFKLLTKMFKKATDEGGQFAGSFESMGGTFDQTWSNMQDSLGIFLSDFVESTGIFDGVKNAIQGVTDFLNELSRKAEEAGGWTEFLKQKFQEFREPIVILGGAIAGALLPFVWSLVGGLWALVAPLLPFIAVGATVAFLADKIAQAFGGWSKVFEFLGQVVENWRQGFQKMIDWLRTARDNIGTIFSKLADMITKPIKRAIDWIREKIQEILDWINERIKIITQVLEDAGKTVRAISGEAQRQTDEIKADVASKVAQRGLTSEQLSRQVREQRQNNTTQQPTTTNVTVNMSGVMASGQTDLRKIGSMLGQAIKDTKTAKNIR